MGRKTMIFAVVVAMAMTVRAAQATLINFDSLGDNVIVTNQYPEATFSSSAPTGVYTMAYDFGSSVPNVIAAGMAFPDGSGTIRIDFTAPVSGLTFRVGAADSTNLLTVDVYVDGVFSQAVSPLFDSDFSTSDLVDLSSFNNVTRIDLSNFDYFGLVYDDFSFTAVPEPSGLGLLGVGLAGLMTLRRKFLSLNRVC
jgi:hypothetical protein